MKLLLIDGSNLIFRAYYATENNKMTNNDGVSTNAIKTIINMLDRLINIEKPDHLFVALDSGKSTFRHKMYDDYKGKRTAAPEQLKEQFPLVIKLFEAMGVKYDYVDDYEADDLIATYAKIAQQENVSVKVISGDKDLLQIVDKGINVLTPKMGFAKEIDYDVETFIEKYTFEPIKMIQYKALVGDTSDNIIGVPKLGDKTAKKLLKEYDNIDNIIEAANNGIIKGKLGENINNNIQNIKNNIKLVTLINNIKVKYNLDELQFNGYNYQNYGEFLRNNGFIKEYNNLIDNGLFDETLNTNDNFITFDDLKYQEITSMEEINYLEEDEFYIYTQSLTDNYYMSLNLGIGIHHNGKNYYISYQNAKKNKFINFLKQKNPKIIYNSKRLMGIFKIYNIENLILDPYLALSLLDSSNFNKDVANIFSAYNIHYIKPFEKIYKSKKNPQILDEEMQKIDIVGKANALSDIKEKLLEDIKNNNLDYVLHSIEEPLSKALVKMEITGINIDLEALERTKRTFEDNNKKFIDQLEQFTDINVNSPTQLAQLLFEEWKLPKQGLKKTTKSISTDIDNLEKLLQLLREAEMDYNQQIDFLEILMEYRKNSKILNTYLKNLKKFILEDQKVHPINNQLLSETGRLSVMDPNIQNMPISGKYSQYIRSLFYAPEGYKLMSFDYSQVELRIMAAMSNDENMLAAFNDNRDIHEETAKKIFSCQEVTPKLRSRAKAINFGIIYGMSPYGLAKQVGITNEEAKQFIEKYFIEFPLIKSFMEETIKEVEKHNYITTISNRKRIINNINSKNFNEREHAKRMAINTPIQGSAADILKLALIKIHEQIDNKQLETKMIMQIHDEIVFLVPNQEIEIIENLVTNIMENTMDLPVKLKVDCGIGKNWLLAK